MNDTGSEANWLFEEALESQSDVTTEARKVYGLEWLRVPARGPSLYNVHSNDGSIQRKCHEELRLSQWFGA